MQKEHIVQCPSEAAARSFVDRVSPGIGNALTKRVISFVIAYVPT